MKKRLIYIISVVGMLVFNAGISTGQTDKNIAKNEYYKAVQYYNTGDYDISAEILQNILKDKIQIDTITLISINNLLGVLSKNLGNFEKAIEVYKENLKLIQEEGKSPRKISKTYNNLANIYKYQGKYLKATSFYWRAINIINNTFPEKEKYYLVEKKYYNLGLVYFYINEYNTSIKYYQKSLSIRKKYKLKGIDKIYHNLARTYTEIGQFKKADFYFKEAIRIRVKEYRENYHRLAPVYMNYGDFLRKQKQFQKAKEYLIKAIYIYEHTYKKRHPYTANSYVYLGKYYTAVNKHDSALYWFQKSLIANSKLFNLEDINKNPDSDDCFSGLQLLRSLKMKAKAIQNIANETSGNEQIEFYKLSLKTVDIAINLISKIRKDYISLDSKLIITEVEKECYSNGVSASTDLYKISGELKYAEKAYKYSSVSKASVLNDNLSEQREINALVPISVKNTKNEFENKISAYKRLIYEENEKLKADSSKISLWKSKLFELNNEYDALIERMKEEYHIPEICTKNIISIKEIQKQLPAKTTLVEYFIFKDKDLQIRTLYTFIINNEGFRQFKRELSNSFENNIAIFKTRMNSFDCSNSDINSFNQFNKACYELYFELIEPVKNTFNGQNIIIVPDENIAYISFDALLSEYNERKRINYADLPYLIHDYCFSYAYSTPLLISNKRKQYSDFVYAFAPEYNDTVINILRQGFGNLPETKKEINSVLKYFQGKKFIGCKALEDSFKSISDKGGILHLAMHALTEEEQKEFSFLVFSNNSDKNTVEDGFLFSYEIERMKIMSPMVVLSACNTGNGKLYSGEGVFSLSRSFIKAGVPAVVYSLWNVNDDAGSKIMSLFYEKLSEGKTKNVALREAKLEYIKTSSPTFINPVYWSGYVVSGDVSAIKSSGKLLYYLIGVGVFVLFIVFFVARRKKV